MKQFNPYYDLFEYRDSPKPIQDPIFDFCDTSQKDVTSSSPFQTFQFRPTVSNILFDPAETIANNEVNDSLTPSYYDYSPSNLFLDYDQFEQEKQTQVSAQYNYENFMKENSFTNQYKTSKNNQEFLSKNTDEDLLLKPTHTQAPTIKINTIKEELQESKSITTTKQNYKTIKEDFNPLKITIKSESNLIKRTYSKASISTMSQPAKKKNLKNGIKNTYINKISQLLSEQQVEKQNPELMKIILDPNLKLSKKLKNKCKKFKTKKPKSYFNIIRQDNKQQKNRQSARNSRLRKKIYQQLLEQKCEELEKKVKKLEETNQESQQNSYALLNQLQNLTENNQKHASSSELEELITSYKETTAIERNNLHNKSFGKIQECFIPQHIRYLLQIASQGQDYFAKSDCSKNFTSYWPILQEKVCLEPERLQNFRKYEGQLSERNYKIQLLLQQQNQIQRELFKEVQKVNPIVNEMEKNLKPEEIAKLLLVFNKKTYDKNTTDQMEPEIEKMVRFN